MSMSGQLASKVSSDELLKNEDDLSFRVRLSPVRLLPDKPQVTLSHHKAKFLGHLPGNRNDYDPSIILSKSQKGQRVIALGMRLYLSCIGLISVTS